MFESIDPRSAQRVEAARHQRVELAHEVGQVAVHVGQQLLILWSGLAIFGVAGSLCSRRGEREHERGARTRVLERQIAAHLTR